MHLQKQRSRYDATIEERLKALPAGFLGDTVDLVFKAYKDCHAEVSLKFPPPEAKDTLPHYRRAWIDKELRNLCVKYRQQGIVSSAEKNVGKNCFHTEVRAGNIVLTVSAVPEEYRLFRSARFRDTLAKVNQPTLFNMALYEQEGDAYYGTILHYQDPKDSRYPKFVSIGFPNRHCSDWVEHLDLVRFCEIDVKKYLDKPTVQPASAQEEIIEDSAKPRLKRRKHRQEQ